MKCTSAIEAGVNVKPSEFVLDVPKRRTGE
jgi:hypothetical protein